MRGQMSPCSPCLLFPTLISPRPHSVSHSMNHSELQKVVRTLLRFHVLNPLTPASHRHREEHPSWKKPYSIVPTSEGCLFHPPNNLPRKCHCPQLTGEETKALGKLSSMPRWQVLHQLTKTYSESPRGGLDQTKVWYHVSTQPRDF